MAIGRVRWFNETKGFGFIENEDGRNIFVNSSAVQGEDPDSLTQGQPVIFDLIESPTGPLALNVERI